MAKYIVFEPEASDECVTRADTWGDDLEDAWDAGHMEIIDIRADPPKRYAGNGQWITLAELLQSREGNDRG